MLLWHRTYHYESLCHYSDYHTEMESSPHSVLPAVYQYRLVPSPPLNLSYFFYHIHNTPEVGALSIWCPAGESLGGPFRPKNTQLSMVTVTSLTPDLLSGPSTQLSVRHVLRQLGQMQLDPVTGLTLFTCSSPLKDNFLPWR